MCTNAEPINAGAKVHFEFSFTDGGGVNFESDFRLWSSCVAMLCELLNYGYNKLRGDEARGPPAEIQCVKRASGKESFFLLNLFKKKLDVFLWWQNLRLFISCKVTISATLDTVWDMNINSKTHRSLN